MPTLPLDALIAALLDGDQARTLEEVRRLRGGGLEKESIITDGIESAMARLDAKCTVEQFNLLEIMLAGRAVMAAIRELYPPEEPPAQTRATIILGTLEGDVHDLGKNILKGVLVARRYAVVDCGKDCPADKLIDAAQAASALAIGVSGLITTVIPQVRRLRERLRERGLGHIKVLAGGAALKQSSPASLNVDHVAETAFDALHYLDSLEVLPR